MRGSHRAPRQRGRRGGSIPAHAGEPKTSTRARAAIRVYPRACGGAMRSRLRPSRTRGLSPRMRGSPRYPRAMRQSGGSIPAHAGEPPVGSSAGVNDGVYPRACGGAHYDWYAKDIIRVCEYYEGSIPAHAGEPICLILCALRDWVYPRACGGARSAASSSRRSRGLSPRMRGSLERAFRDHAGVGSIPAHAGEPRPAAPPRRRSRVYPRACGGACIAHYLRHGFQGLSPRMRGSQAYEQEQRLTAGSIPAHAGEPARTSPMAKSMGVYPRACGGALTG